MLGLSQECCEKFIKVCLKPNKQMFQDVCTMGNLPNLGTGGFYPACTGKYRKATGRLKHLSEITVLFPMFWPSQQVIYSNLQSPHSSRMNWNMRQACSCPLLLSVKNMSESAETNRIALAPNKIDVLIEQHVYFGIAFVRQRRYVQANLWRLLFQIDKSLLIL